MWQDMVFYWASRGLDKQPPPTIKRLEYAHIHYPNWKPEPMTMKICCGVFDDEKYTETKRNEIQWHADRGAIISWGHSANIV